MSTEPHPQISNTTFQQGKTTEASIISDHLRTCNITLDLDHSHHRQDYLLKPPSIFSDLPQTCTLERYFKIKMLDKPKDTLAWIMSKKQQFQRYINRTANQHQENQRTLQLSNNRYQDLSRQIFYQHTFTKNVAPQTILSIKITPSIRRKCNIVLSNLRGEIIRYYPNVLFIKKGGKILKVVSKFSSNFFYIDDACFKEFNTKYFLPFFRQNVCFCYRIRLNQQAVCENLAWLEEFKQKYEANLTTCQKCIKVMKYKPECSIFQMILPEAEAIIQQKQQQQNTFLLSFRGHKQQSQKNVSFDFMAVNLWKQLGCESEILANKINQLFDLKAENTMSMIPQQKQSDLHLPFKTEKEQNCALCIYKNLNKAKPKRTHWVCQVCSSQKQKPLYLCRKCFGEYHQKSNICLFKKYQKKPSRTLKIKRKECQDNLNGSNNCKPFETKEQQEECENEEKAQLFNRLNRLQEEFFLKIGSMIEEGQDNNLKSCKFYLSMLLNTNLQFVNKIDQQRKENSEKL